MTRHHVLSMVGVVLLLASLKLRQFALASQDPTALQPLLLLVVFLTVSYCTYSYLTFFRTK